MTGRLLAALLLVGLALAPGGARAGAFFFVTNDGEEDRITHPNGYDGTGGVVDVTVCVDPSSANASDMLVPLDNVARTLTGLVPTTGNTLSGGATNVPFSEVDFETVLLHELGHCMGLGHPNLGSESGLTGSDQDYARATDGVDDIYDRDDGADNVIASADDQRDDDLNLHWFRVLNNDPFTLGATVDGTTYSRLAADLPGGDDFAAIASRDVAALLGVPGGVTEAVMHQGAFFGEAQRDLNHDDVATLRLAMSGLDETSGTSDDYSFTVTPVGLSASCDIVIDFDDTETGFAACRSGGEFLGATEHLHMGPLFNPGVTPPRVYFNSEAAWFFNPDSNAPKVPSLSGVAGLGLAAACLGAAWTRLRRRA